LFFTISNDSNSKRNKIVWLYKWIIERQTLRYLAKESGYSVSTLKRLFSNYLQDPPPFQFKSRTDVHLIIDGTYFSNDICLVLYQDNDIKYTQLYRFSKGERFNEILEDLDNLASMGVIIDSVTCDGHKAILKAIRQHNRKIVIQRCVVHVHRMANIWLRAKPKSLASNELKECLIYLPKIKNHNDKIAWMASFKKWEIKHKAFVNEKTFNIDSSRWWYKHKELRRAYILVKQALPDMFHYLNNSNIPKSTNSLESFFGHLKDNLSIHRGLSYEHRKSFIRWYLHFKNRTRDRFS
jgi:Transposase, Mutator family